MQKPDFDTIKKYYEISFSEATAGGNRNLDPDIEDWFAILNEVQFNLYQDIKFAGLRLYPLYPVGPYFIDFGNPFEKIGVEIFYKNHGQPEKQGRIDYFKSLGWTVYTIESRDTYDTAYKLFDQQKDKFDVEELDQLDIEDWLKFMEENKETNSQCLMHYLREKHFKNTGVTAIESEESEWTSLADIYKKRGYLNPPD